MNTKRLHKASKRRRQVYMKKLLLVLTAVIFVIGLSISVGGNLVDAHEDNHESLVITKKYYKSIEISEGDSLWKIAEEYMSEEYGSIHEYIDEIKEMNNLLTDDIHDGQYLTIAYYDAI